MEGLEHIMAIHADEITTSGLVSEEDIKEAEESLHIKFDESYRNYLSEYGVFVYRSIELYGLGVPESSHLHVVQATSKLRNYQENLPNDGVLFEDIGEANYMLYIMHRGVYHWWPSGKEKTADNIYEYIQMRVDEVQ